MKKLFLIISLMIFANFNSDRVSAAAAVPVPAAVEIIPNASYYINENIDQNGILTHYFVPGDNSIAFYTFDGELINRINGNPYLGRINENGESLLNTMLDPEAPKPQPTSSKIRYWPAYNFGAKGTKGAPGWFICFYDKNGNHIKSYRCSEDGTIINTTLEQNFDFNKNNPNVIDEAFPLNLNLIENIIQEEKPAEIKPLTFKDLVLENKWKLLLIPTGLMTLKATHAACEIKLKGKKNVSKTEYAKTFGKTFIELSKNLIKHPITSAQQQKLFTTGVAALLGGGILIKLNS